jgi:membrane-associated protease RseP (regulator of RpoE activity)
MEVTESGKLPPEFAEVEKLVDKRFEILDFTLSRGKMKLLVDARDPKKSFSDLLGELRRHGYLVAMREQEHKLGLVVAKAPLAGGGNVWINVALLLATLGTTFAAGYFLRSNFLDAALFSSALMTILGAHEFGHKISTWRHGVAATPPYFIPAPTLIGTFGAVIKIKSPIPTKEALVEMGASGPMLGFLFALPITIVGMSLSQPTGGEIFQVLPPSLLFAFLGSLTFGSFPTTLNPHPLAFAGWIGLLVTWLNLMPAGQLDGGHVARGLLSRNQHYMLTRALGFALVLLGFLWFPFLIWGLLILFLFGAPHRGALNNVSKLSRRQKFLAIAAFVVFILCLPIPLW